MIRFVFVCLRVGGGGGDGVVFVMPNILSFLSGG